MSRERYVDSTIALLYAYLQPIPMPEPPEVEAFGDRIERVNEHYTDENGVRLQCAYFVNLAYHAFAQ